MNIYVSDEIKEKWMNYEFQGTPFVLRNGKTYIRAYSKTFDCTHFYSFSEDFMWWYKEDILTLSI